MRKISLIVGIAIVMSAFLCAYSFSQPVDVSNPDASAYGKESVKKSVQRSKQAEEAGAQMVLSGPVTLFPETETESGAAPETGLIQEAGEGAEESAALSEPTDVADTPGQ